MSEVSGSIRHEAENGACQDLTVDSIDLCCIYLVFTHVKYIFVQAHVQLRVVLRPRCKGSTLSSDMSEESGQRLHRVRTLFSIAPLLYLPRVYHALIQRRMLMRMYS